MRVWIHPFVGFMLASGLAALSLRFGDSDGLRVLEDLGATITGSESEFLCIAVSVTEACASETPACIPHVPPQPPNQCTTCDGGAAVVGRCRGEKGDCNLSGPTSKSCGKQAFGVCVVDWPAPGYTRCQPTVTTIQSCTTTTQSRCTL